MEKVYIQNRKGQKISVLIQLSEEQKGLAFVMHGLSGYKEQSHLEVITLAFLEHGFSVVRFDTTNTFGESDGAYEDATITNYYEDLEDVIRWASGEKWYQEPFVLAGHSLGGICTALYAEKYSEKVVGLAPIATVVSGKLSIESKKDTGVIEEWQKTGWRTERSFSGKEKRLKWSHMEDRLQYDLLPEAGKLTMPVLLIVGELDESTPPQHQQILHDALPGRKELHILKGAPHTFRDPGHLAELKKLFNTWIETALS